MEEAVRSLEERYSHLESVLMKLNEVNDSLLKKMDAITVQASKAARNDQEAGILGHSPHDQGPIINPQTNTPTPIRQFGYVPKLEFPQFDGTTPRLWIKKAEKYFKLCKISDEQRLNLVSIHLVGKAEHWFHSYIAARQNVDWSTFIVDLCSRFGEELGMNVVEEFNKLEQKGAIDDYLYAFENLRSLMIQRNPQLPDSFFLDSFIGGLKPTIKPFMKAFNPMKLDDAVEFARLKEQNDEAMKAVMKPSLSFNRRPFLPDKDSAPPQRSNQLSNMFQKTAPPSNLPVPKSIKLTPAERRLKQEKGLCCICDQPYGRGHVCPIK